MATRTLKFGEWWKAVTRHALDDGFLKVSGYPIVDVAKRLDISEQRVRQLIEADQLDAIQVLTWKGNVAVTLVTQASLEAYEPRPAGRPVQLELSTH
jgi:hypothetical protein